MCHELGKFLRTLGVDEEMKHFPDHIGHTNEACAAYRDQMLIELLKLHKKL